MLDTYELAEYDIDLIDKNVRSQILEARSKEGGKKVNIRYDNW